MPNLEKKTRPSENEIREFWDWCGFKHDVPFPELAKRKDIPNPERFTKEQWYIHDGIVKGAIPYCGSMPPIDFNFLWKYSIPRLCKKYQGYHLLLHDWVDQCTGDYEKDTLALFWILWRIK